MSYASLRSPVTRSNREENFAVELAARSDNYAELLKHKNLGGNCGVCGLSNMGPETLHCGLKKSKVVNKLAICPHFKG